MSNYATLLNNGASLTFVVASYFKKTKNLEDGAGDRARQGKTVRFSDGAAEKVKDSDKATFFEFQIAPVNDLDDLFLTLKNGARQGHALIQGAPLEAHYNIGPIVRRWETEPATITGVARPYMIVDADYNEAVEGLDLSDVVAVAEHVRGLLPPIFNGVRCVAYLTAGHGARGCLRCRLIFWLDRPLALAEQKALLRSAEVIFDESIYGLGSLIYTNFLVAKDSEPDIFKRRWAIIDGSPHVTTPNAKWFAANTDEAHIVARKARAATVAKERDVQGGYPIGSFEELLLCFGDNDDDNPGGGRSGFFRPITSAIFAFIDESHRHGVEVDDKELKERLCEAIDAAPIKKGRHPNEKQKYQKSLDGHISQLVAIEQAKIAKMKIATLAPAVSLTEASEMIRRAASRILVDELQPPPAFEAAIDDDGSVVVDPINWGGSGKTHLMRVTVGTGKTHELIGMIAEAVVFGLRVALVVPMHKLAREAQARLKDVGVDAKIWLGVGQEILGDEQTQKCEYADMLPLAFKFGASIRDVCAGCEFRPDCFYPKQNVKRADVVIFAGAAYLWSIPQNARDDDRLKQFDLVVIDEAPIANFVQPPAPYSRDDFRTEIPPDVMVEDADLGAEGLKRMSAFAQLFDSNSERFSFLDIARLFPGFAPSDWHKTERMLRGALVRPAKLVKELRASRGQRRRKTPAEQHNERIVELLKLCDAMAILAHERIGRTDLGDETPRLRLAGGELMVLGRKTLHPDWRSATRIVLDATADVELMEMCFGKLESVTDVRVEPGGGVRFHQVDHHYSYGWLGITNEPKTRNDKALFAQRHSKLRGFVQQLSGRFLGATTGVIGPKDLIEPIDANGKRIEGAGLCDGLERVQATWFGALRGLDAMKDVRHLVVISRTLPRTEIVETIAEALAGEAITHRDEWKHKPALRRIVTEKGSVVAPAKMVMHSDATAEKVRRALCEAEVMQAIGRSRWVRRGIDTPLDVWILNTLMLDEFEVELVLEPWFSRVMVNGIALLLSEGIVPEKAGRREVLSAMTRLKPEKLKALGREMAPEGGTVWGWWENEREFVELMGAGRFRATAEGADGHLWIEGCWGSSEAAERLLRAGCTKEVILEPAPLDRRTEWRHRNVPKREG